MKPDDLCGRLAVAAAYLASAAAFALGLWLALVRVSLLVRYQPGEF